MARPEDRSAVSPHTTVGETSPIHPAPREVEAPPAPIAAYPKWRYHKDKGAVIVEGPEQEEAQGEGWQDTPVPFGPEDTKGMKTTDEALKKYTDAVYPKGYRDEGDRTDEAAIAASESARKNAGVTDDPAGAVKQEALAKQEAARVEKDAKAREQAEQAQAKGRKPV